MATRRGAGGDQSPNERRHQERMARKSSVPPQHRQPQSADVPSAQWDDGRLGTGGRAPQGSPACCPNRIPGSIGSATRSPGGAGLMGGRWVRRFVSVVGASDGGSLPAAFGRACGGGSAAGPINLDIGHPPGSPRRSKRKHRQWQPPSRSAAPQIERAGRIRIAVRHPPTIVVRDRTPRPCDRIARARPKAEVQAFPAQHF